MLGSGAPVRAAQPTPAPDPFYGSWYDGLSPSSQEAQGEMDRLASAGIGLTRQYVWWNRIETSPGTYDWSRTDQLVTDATARGMRLLPTLLYTPSFYSSKPAGSTATAQFPPSDPQTMARFAAAMVKRYGPNGSYWCPPIGPVPGPCKSPNVPITSWEIWNEPDYSAWWKGAPNASEYAALLGAVSAGIKGVDPKANVVLGSMTNAGGSTTGGFLDQLYALGAGRYFDTLSLNPYARNVGGLVAYLRGERAVATRNGDGAKPIRVTEYGWATGGNSPYLVTDEPCQAALLYAATRRMTELRQELNLQAVTQFQWHDVATTSTPWPYYAGVIRADDTAKPGLSALTEAIAGRSAPAGLTLQEACPADRQSLDGTLQTLTVSRAGPGSGALTSSPNGISCGTDCSQEYAPGASVTLTATPDAGSYVAGWQGAPCSGTTCTVSMDTARTVTAVFATPPGPPTAVSAAGGAAAATVSFGAPASDGGSPITGYTVTATDTTTGGNGGQTATGTGSPITVSGLTNGDTYTFSVTAANAAGQGPASASSNSVTPAAASSATTLQESAAAVRYNAWTGTTDPKASGGGYRMSQTANANVTFKFTGTAVKWLMRAGPDRGQAAVTIDGVSKGAVDQYAASLSSKTQTYSGLANASHTLVLKVRGTKSATSTAANVTVDGFLVGTSTTPVQDSSTKVTYDTWVGATSASASGRSYRGSGTTGATATLSFTGTGVDWITAVGTGYGKASITLDGGAAITVDLYSASQRWKVVGRSFTGLGSGTHTITVRTLGAKNASATATKVIVDAFIIHG